LLHIIIPYYKLDYFETTLASLKNQTDQRFKVFIGNDASPESPEELIEKYKGTFDCTYQYFSENLGGTSLVHQWERCMDLVDFKSEDWMMILGDDDFLAENFVEEFYKHFPTFQGKAHVVRFATKLIDEQKQQTSDVYTHPVWEDKLEAFFRRIKGYTRGSLSEQVFSYKTYQKFGFRKYPLAWHSDDIAWLDFPQDTQLYTINDTIVYVRHSDSNITGKVDNLTEKNNASLLYLQDVIAEYAPLLPLKKRINIYLMYEGRLKNTRRLNTSDWRYLFRLYAKTYSLLYIAKIIRRMVIYQFKKS
jgi:glycosyltransferase involved in cell wall biosynthesis